MAKWTASKLEKLRANVINGEDDEQETTKGNWTPAKLEKLRSGIIDDMSTRDVPTDTRLFSHEDEQSLLDLANLESTTGIGSASSDADNSDTFTKFVEALDKANQLRNNPFTALKEGISEGINFFDPNGDKALLTEEQKVNYANNNLSNLSEEDLNKLRHFAEQSDNRDINIINSLSLGATGDTSSAMRMANAKKEQDEIKQEMQERLGIDDETFNKYVSSANYLRNLEDRKKQQEELANADAGTMAAANVASILTAPIRSAFSVAGYVNEYANPYRDENFDVDHNAMAFDVANFNKDTTQQTSKNIDENVDNEVGKFALQTLYQGGKSGIESMLRLGTVGQAGTIVEAGLEAYDNAREEAQERGLTKEQAIETAVAQGMAEAAFEVLPVENLGKLFKQGGEVAAKGVKNVFKEIGKQSAFEGLEEVETNLANLLTDAMINKDKSEFNVKVEDYKAQGMDEDEAFKTTLMDTVTDNVQAFLGGAVGGLLGGGTAVGSNVAMQKEAKKLDGNYREVAQAIPDNVEDYNSEEDYNKAMEVKALAEELDTQDKVSSADRAGLLQDIYAVNETMPNTDLIENINESVNSPFADVGGFQVTKNDITSQEVAQSMAQANNVNDFVEAYRDSQASSNAEARQTGQEYFETLAPKFDTYDEGSRPLDLALTQRSAEDLYTAALNGEEVNQEELNTTKKQQLFQRGMLENTVKQEVEAQRQARREEQKTFEPAQLHNIETPQGKADIADITLDNDGNFKWTKGDEEVVVPRKDISDNAMQRFMVNALNQPTLSAKQLYIDNYDGSIPIGSYNNAYESAFNAGQLNSKNFKGWLGSHKFYARSIPESTLEAFFNEGAKQVENKSKKVTSAKTKGTGKVTAEKSVENTPLHKLAQAFASKTGIDVEIRDGSILVTDGAQNALTDAEGNEIYSNGQFQADISKVIVGANGKELQTFMHEAIGEVLEAYNPEDMADIQDAILNYLLESKGDNYVDKTIKRYQRLYTAAEGTKSYRDAANEMINDTLVGLFTTDKGANDFVNWCTKNDKSVLEKITDFIQAIIDKLKSLVSDANLSSEARTVAEMSEKQAQKIRDRLFKAMDKAIDNYQGTATKDDIEVLAYGEDVRNSIGVTDKKTLDFLNNQDYITTYRAFQVIDGGLYSPMNAKQGGKLGYKSELGAWEQSIEEPEKAKWNEKKQGYYYDLKQGNFSKSKKNRVTSNVAYNPYLHSSNVVFNDQFPIAYDRPNLVVVECQVPVSELEGTYHAEKAHDPTGWREWKSGAVSTALKKYKGIERKVMLSRWMKPIRILDNKEVAQIYKETLDGTGIKVNWNVVPEGLLDELEKIDVEIDYDYVYKTSGGGTTYEDAYGDRPRGTANSTRHSLDIDDIDEELMSDYELDILNEWFASEQPTKAEKKEAVKFGKGYDFVESGNKKLAYTEDRINYLLDSYAASDPNYAQAYVAYINPIDFLKLTTGANQRAMERIEREGKKLDLEELREETQPLYLNIDEEEGEVIGHEGRHRMYALYKEGYTSVPILLFNYQNKYSKQNIDSIDLLPQWFSEKDDNLSDRITVTNLIPFSRGNEEEIRAQYGKGTSADARFSLDVDTEGNELSEQQQDFFKDSKIRDEQGRLKVMFHGTQDADFTVFDTDYSKDNISLFFTDNETVAKGYSSSRKRIKFNYTLDDLRGMLGSYEKIIKSGDTYKLQERTPSDKINTLFEGSFNEMKDYVVEMYGDINRSGNYAVYLNATNPYIVDAKGNNFDAIPHGKETWDTRKLAEYAKNKGYDSLIINDVIDTALYASNEERIQESQIVVVFDSNQVKSIDNTNPTESADIRYSLDVPTTYALDEDLSDEELKELFPGSDDDMIEYKDSKNLFVNTVMDAASKVLDFNISDSQVNQIAKWLIDTYNSEETEEYISRNLRNIFSGLKTNNYEDMVNALQNLTEEVAEKAKEVDPDDKARYDSFIKSIPTFRFSDYQVKEMQNRGIYNNVFGKIGFKTNSNSTTLDGNTYWEICDAAQAHGYTMKREVSDLDQIDEISKAIDYFKPQTKPMFEGADITDGALESAREIMRRYFKYAQLANQTDDSLKEVQRELKRQTDEYKKKVGKIYQEQVKKLQDELSQLKDEKKLANMQGQQLYDRVVKAENSKGADTEEVKRLKMENWQLNTDLQQAQRMALRDKKSLSRKIERMERNKHLKSIRNQAIRLIKMIDTPTRTKFVPEILQKPTIEMLRSLDIVTYRVRKNGELVPWGEEKGGEPTKTTLLWHQKLKELQGVLKELESITDDKTDLSKYGANASYLYNLGAELGDITNGLLDKFLQDTPRVNIKISMLDSGKLKELDDFMKSYLASINGAQEVMIDGNNVELAKIGQQVASEISELKSLNAVAGTIKKKILDFLNLDMAEPITVFSELGGTMEKLYWHLEKGKDVRDGHIFATEDAFSKAKDELNIDKNEPSKWETGLMSFKDGQLQLTPAQVMSLYAAYGRNQARHHIIFGGVMSSDEGLRGKDKKLKKVQTKPVHLTPKDVEDIVNTLTPQQKALADFMVDYMSNEVSDWGNRVSQKRWGIRLFTESHYFPIKTFDVTRPSRTMDENANASLFSLQNQGFTKPLQKDANNALVLEDIFKVFSDHVAKMAAYDGYVIPINDFMRVFNFAESEETFVVKQGEEGQYRTDASVKEQIQRVFGKQGTQYFTKFIKNVNEDFGEGGSINLIDKLFSNNKAQAVLANGRVVIQQPTAYPRAMEVIDGKYLVKALSTSAVGLKKKIQRSKSHNTLAKFKSKGYYETSIGQSMQQMITGTATTKDKVNEVAGALAGLADDITWSIIYQAAEYKVQAEQKKLEVDSKEYFDAVNKIANEAFVKTQVVDSVFTKSQMMRSRDTGDKMLTAFMAEPTKYYNMLHRGVFNMVQHGNKKAFAKAVYLFVVGQVLNSVAQSAYDAWRDDDDEKDAMEKFLNALLGISDIQEADGVWATMQAILKANLVENLLPINLLPVVKEVNSALAGWDSKNMSTQAIYDIVGDAKKIVDWAEGKGTLTTYGVLNTVAHSLSLATGMPFSSALREVKDLYNNVNNLWDGTNLVKNEQHESAKAQIAKSDNIQETVKTLYQEKVQENLEKGKTQQEAEKAAKSSVGSAITGAYKNDLVEAKKNNMSEATSMKAEAIKGFTALGISQADANKRVEKWFK